MTARFTQKSDVAIVVFYPGKSLMHQVASWASDRPSSELQFSFARSVAEIRRALRRADVAIIDATEDPARAMETLVRAVTESDPGSVSVYTEIMHPGLELFVRSRGVLLLLGPMLDKPWQNLFEAMALPKRQMSGCGAPSWERKENRINAQESQSSTGRTEDVAGDEFRKSA